MTLKKIIIIIPLLTCILLNAQVQVRSSVWDAETQQPLPYCNIILKNSTEGAITNADGRFILNAKSMSDSVLFYYIGYAKKIMTVKDIMENDKIYLQPQSIQLLSVIITPSADFFYDMILKCRLNLQKSKSKHTAKVYYGLNTTRDGVPAEVLECYYNCDIKGRTLDNFLLKNGKVGLKSKDSLVFFKF